MTPKGDHPGDRRAGGPNRVLQCKTQQSDGYNAVQLGFGEQKEQRLTKPLLGHIKKFNGLPVKRILEFRDFSKEVKPGDVVGPALFAPGDFVDAIGFTKGRGFEGVVKRHRFRGGDSTHGAKGWHRRAGAIGNRLFPGTVNRGMKMPATWARCGAPPRTCRSCRSAKRTTCS